MKENLFGESLGIVVLNHINKIKNHEIATVSILVTSALHLVKFMIIPQVPREELYRILRREKSVKPAQKLKVGILRLL